MNYREWQADILRREAEYITNRAPIPAMDAERKYALNVDDFQFLRKMDTAFKESA